MKGETLANLIQCGVTLLLGIIALAGALWKSHSTLPLLATQNYPFWLKYD